MKEILLSILAGIVCGTIFAVLKLPAPNPPTIAGVLGIVGLLLGMWLGQRIIEIFK